MGLGMKNKEYGKDIEQERIKETCDYWQRVLDLGHIAVTLFYEYEPDDEGIAEVYVRPEYRDANITWNTANTVKLGRIELEDHALHEFGHILSWSGNKELIAENFARAIRGTITELEGA